MQDDKDGKLIHSQQGIQKDSPKMAKDVTVEIDETTAKRIIKEHETRRKEDFLKELNALMQKYGVNLEPTITIGSTGVLSAGFDIVDKS